MLNKNQSQSVSEGAIAVQAGGSVVITQGVTYTECRQIALDLIRENLTKGSALAMEIVDQRVQGFLDQFLEKLQKENPKGIEQAHDPGFQHSLFEAEKEYARTGDDDLAKTLVDLLVDRSKQEKRNFRQVVIEESISTVAKLTYQQLAILAVVFVFHRVRFAPVDSVESLCKFFDKVVSPFVGSLPEDLQHYQHLEFTAAATRVSIQATTLADLISNEYPGLFSAGFHSAELDSFSPAIRDVSSLFRRCLNNDQRIQVNAVDSRQLDQMTAHMGISSEERERLRGLLQNHRMDSEGVRRLLSDKRDYMKRLFDLWQSTALKSMQLTTVGTALGHAKVKQFDESFPGLDIWIPS